MVCMYYVIAWIMLNLLQRHVISYLLCVSHMTIHPFSIMISLL